MAFLAVAHEAAAHQVAAHGEAAVDFGDDVIKRGRAAERITAVGAAMVPCEVDLITGGAPRDQLGLINVVPIH